MTEACLAVGNKVHMPMMNQFREEGHICPLLNMPLINTKLNYMFLPLMKEALIKGGADAKTSLSLVIIKYSAPLLSVMLKGQKIIYRVDFDHNENISTPIKILDTPLIYDNN